MNADIDMIYRLYVIEKKPMYQVASEMGIATGSVHKLIHAHNIPVHRIMPPKSEAEKARISKLHKGKRLSKEQIEKMAEAHRIHGAGHTKVRDDGYVAVYYPEHPNSNKSGYVMQHHLVMEDHIGRLIRKDEVVHHINHNRADNRLENLQLLTFKEHASLHMKERYEKRRNDLLTK